jgi:hypothetical protein
MNKSEKTPFQEFAENILFQILFDKSVLRLLAGKTRQEGIYKTIEFLVRHYPEYARDGKKSYQKLDRYRKYHRFSKEAEDRLTKAEQTETPEKDIIRKLLFYEHITPNKALINELITAAETEITKEKISEIMSKAEVVIISKEEQQKLDRKMKSFGSREERIKEIKMEFAQPYCQNNICN